MRKANKPRFIVLLCFAIAFIAATLAMLFIPEKKSLKITEEIGISSIDGEYAFRGKLKNVTDDEVELTNSNFEIEVSSINSNGYNNVNIFRLANSDGFTLQPNEEFDLSEINLRLPGAQSAEIVRIIYTPDKVHQAIYGGSVVNGNLAVFALLTGIIGAAFLLIAIVSYVTDIRNTKRANNIIEQTKQTLGENAYYVEGGYGNKAANRTAAAKTTASVFGAVVSAIFLGFGRYRVYSTRNGGTQGRDEFIIDETSIYMYINGKFQNVTNELKSVFVNPVITDKKNKIHVNGNDKNIYLTLITGNEDKAGIIANLKNIFENQEPDNGETDKDDN